MPSDSSTAEILHGGECPVCGDEFGCGFDDIKEGESIDGARICVIEIDEDGGMGDGIIHLPQEVSNG